MTKLKLLTVLPVLAIGCVGFAQKNKPLTIGWLPFQIIGDDTNRYAELEAEDVMQKILQQPSQSALDIIGGARVLDVWENTMGMPKPMRTGDDKAEPMNLKEEKLRELCAKVGATHLISGTIRLHRKRDYVSRSTTDLFARVDLVVVTPKERTYLFNWDLKIDENPERKDHKNWFNVPRDPVQREWKVLRYLASYSDRPKDVKLMYQKATGVALAAALSEWYTATFPDK